MRRYAEPHFTGTLRVALHSARIYLSGHLRAGSPRDGEFPQRDDSGLLVRSHKQAWMSMSRLDLWRTPADVAALFARSLRDYFDSCKTACNLTARRDRVSAGLQCRQEQAYLPVKSPSLENTHACTDMCTHESWHKDVRARALENAVWNGGLYGLLVPIGRQLLVIHLCTEFS